MQGSRSAFQLQTAIVQSVPGTMHCEIAVCHRFTRHHWTPSAMAHSSCPLDLALRDHASRCLGPPLLDCHLAPSTLSFLNKNRQARRPFLFQTNQEMPKHHYLCRRLDSLSLCPQNGCPRMDQLPSNLALRDQSGQIDKRQCRHIRAAAPIALRHHDLDRPKATGLARRHPCSCTGSRVPAQQEALAASLPPSAQETI